MDDNLLWKTEIDILLRKDSDAFMAQCLDGDEFDQDSPLKSILLPSHNGTNPPWRR